MPRKPITFAEVTKLALALPDVETGTTHGATSLKVRGKLLACPALHRSAEPDTLAVRLDPGARAQLLRSYPDIYYVTPHYVDYPTVLVRLSRIDRGSLKQLLLTALGSARGEQARGRRRAGGAPRSARRSARLPG